MLPDGLKQTLYHPSDRPEVPVPRLIESSSHVARVLDDYFHFGLDMHLQSRLGRITHDSEGFSAFLEGSRVDLCQPTAWLHVVLYAMYLNARRVNNPVLVLVPAIVHKPKCPMLNSASVRIRLQPLNERLWTWSDPSNQVAPAIESVPPSAVSALSSRRFVESGTASEYRERAPRKRPTGPVDGQLINGVVQGRSEVVECLTEDDTPFRRKVRSIRK